MTTSTNDEAAGSVDTDLHSELLGVVEDAIASQPRSLQKAIGPSEIGHPCARRIAYKLAGAPEVNTGRLTPWKPAIGTAVHAWLDEVFTAANERQPDYHTTGGRYWCEVRVTVGEIAGRPVEGNSDLYVDGTVLDFKITGDEMLRGYKRNGPGAQYRAQAHLYGRGHQRAGRPVHTVAIWFLPRNQELRQNYYWSEPYDEQVAIAALDRVEGIAKLVGALGAAAAGLLPATEAYCSGCPFFRPGSTDLATGCPGAITAPDPRKEFAGLVT